MIHPVCSQRIKDEKIYVIAKESLVLITIVKLILNDGVFWSFERSQRSGEFIKTAKQSLTVAHAGDKARTYTDRYG